MENIFNISAKFELIGIAEMEDLKYLYGVLFLAIYLFIILLNFMIVFVILTEETLHKPMYILICNLAINGIFGSSMFLPKLIVDVFTSSKVISREGCLIQAFCTLCFAYFEVSTFTIMAYDRYLAICHPLHYVTLMTNDKVVKVIMGSLVFTFLVVLIAILLSVRLPTCGTHIKNIFCDNMAFLILSCTDISINNIYGAIITVVFLIITGLIIVYSYLKIFIICLKFSKDAYQKATHTLVTHLLNFSIFILGFMFIFIRYRLINVTLPLVVNIVLSVTCLLFPPLLNPLVYGIRTKALKNKLIHHLKNINAWTKL
ncbi:olfactory receptor 51G2-like [Pelodytes ibericus]